MSDISWLYIDVQTVVDSNTTTSGDLIYLDGDSTITKADLNTYKGKAVFVNGDLTFAMTKKNNSLNLLGAKFFVSGTTHIDLSGNSAFMKSNGFNDCMNLFRRGHSHHREDPEPL
jgi:predicted phosphodiesterase